MSDERLQVQVALRNYPAIAEYPLAMTKAMAQRAWLERYEQKRIIVQQTHPAQCYYIILSGSGINVTPLTCDSITRAVTSFRAS